MQDQKVSQYFTDVVSQRPYKYQTKINMVACLKYLKLWDMPLNLVTPALCWQRLDGVVNQNVKRTYSGYIRNMFGFNKHQIPVVEGYSRTYNLPPIELIISAISRSKYQLFFELCLFAGLRIGEACAITPKQVVKEGNLYFINVDRSYSQDGLFLTSPKTIGRVAVPEWLALKVLDMKPSDLWPKNTPTKNITNACLSLGRREKIRISPHMLRHWFATDMAKRLVAPSVIMKQMRHKTIRTAMEVYVQVNNQDLVSAIPVKPDILPKLEEVKPAKLPKKSSKEKVIEYSMFN